VPLTVQEVVNFNIWIGKGGWAKGLGGHDFSFGGRVCFFFQVGGFKSLNIYF
jgi:hypothetical protein